jgi:hypothetical protein
MIHFPRPTVSPKLTLASAGLFLLTGCLLLTLNYLRSAERSA